MKGFDDECFVRGPLALTLHVSRALGVAPLGMERTRIGWRVSYSRPFAIYSYVWMALMHTMMLYGFYQEYCLPSDDTTRIRSTASVIGWTAIFVVNGCMCTIGVITGPKRMRLMIDYVNKMDNIHKNFCKTGAWRTNKKKRTVAAGFTIFVLFSLYIYTYVGTVIHVLDAGTNWRVLFLFPCTYIENMMVHLVMMQFAFVGYMIASCMKYMNRAFEDLIHIDDSQIKSRPYKLIEGVLGVMIPLPKFRGIVTVAERPTGISNDIIIRDSTDLPSISSYGYAYALITDVQLQVDDSFGTLLILLTTAIFIQLLVSVYSYVFYISASQDAQHYLGVSSCLMQVFFLLMVTEPTESIKLQVQRIRFLLSHMYRRVEPDDPRCTELHFLYEQLTLDNPVFVVSGLCKLRRSILFLMISGIFTYITFLWQFNLSV